MSKNLTFVNTTVNVPTASDDPSWAEGITDALTAISAGMAELQPNQINVKSFNAKGDGVSDDTIPFQNALREAAGKSLFIPAGTYLITDQLDVDSDTYIFGEGSGSIILSGYSQSSTATNVIFRINTKENVHFDKLKIVGNSNTELGNQYGFYFSDSDSCSIENCTITGTDDGEGFNIQILLTRCTKFEISDNECYRCPGGTSGHGYGILVQDNSSLICVHDNAFDWSQSNTVLTTTGTTTAGSNVLAVASTTGLNWGTISPSTYGHTIIGGGIPEGTTVVSVSGLNITMSNVADEDHTGEAITFTNQWGGRHCVSISYGSTNCVVINNSFKNSKLEAVSTNSISVLGIAGDVTAGSNVITNVVANVAPAYTLADVIAGYLIKGVLELPEGTKVVSVDTNAETITVDNVATGDNSFFGGTYSDSIHVIQQPVSRCFISSNIIDSSRTYGIAINGNNEYIKVNDNIISNSGLDGIFIEGEVDGYFSRTINSTFTDNKIFKAGGYGIINYSGDTNIFSNNTVKAVGLKDLSGSGSYVGIYMTVNATGTQPFNRGSYNSVIGNIIEQTGTSDQGISVPSIKAGIRINVDANFSYVAVNRILTDNIWDTPFLDDATNTYTPTEYATNTTEGIVSTTDQSFGGPKRFIGGTSGSDTTFDFTRYTNAGDGTDPVQIRLGNSGSNQGLARIVYNNAAASGAPQFKIAFDPRNNAGSTSYNSGEIKFLKTAGNNGCTITFSTADTSGTLTEAGVVNPNQTWSLGKSGSVLENTINGSLTASVGYKAPYFQTSTSNGSSSGVVRLANTDSVGFRNGANSGNNLLGSNSSNNLTWNGIPLRVSVKDFGATGDGTTNDTAAINLAISTLSSGGEVHFPPGTYKCTTGLVCAVGNIRLTGEGRASKIVLPVGQKISITASGFSCENLWIDGTDSTSLAAGYSSSRLLSIRGADSNNYLTNIKVSNCFFTNSAFYGIECEWVSGLLVCDNFLDYMSNTGIALLSVLDFEVTRNIVTNVNMPTAANPGSFYTNSYGIFASENNLGGSSNFTGTTTTGSNVITAVSSISGLVIGQCLIHSNLPDISRITAITSTTVTVDTLATGNATGTTIYVTNPPSERGIISNNKVHNNPVWEGLDTHSGRDISFIGNEVSNCRMGVSVGNSGVNFKMPPQRINIVGNNLKACYSEDTTKTATSSGTTITLNAAPSFQLFVGNILIVGSDVRRITAITSQTVFTIASVLSAPATNAACTVTQKGGNGPNSLGIALGGTGFTLGDGNHTADGCVISGNTIVGFGSEEDTYGAGIYVQAVRGISITGNTIIEPNQLGIFMYHDVYGATVSGNTVVDPWSYAKTDPCAVTMNSDYQYCTISGNTFKRGLKVATYTLARGITYPSGGTNLNVVLGENYYDGDLTLFAVNVPASTFTDSHNRHPQRFMSSTVPASGTWYKGDIVWNSNTSVNGTLGWICYSPGTPGSWATMPLVSDTGQLQIGDKITALQAASSSTSDAVHEAQAEGTGGDAIFRSSFTNVSDKWAAGMKRTDKSYRIGYDSTNGRLGVADFLQIQTLGNAAVGKASLATNATDGHLYIPVCAGTPTGVPTGVTGYIPLVFDSTNNKIYFYNGSWKSVTVT